MKDVMLTTIDNPFDPFTQYDDWFAYDVQMGYNTCEYLGRFSYTSSEFTPALQLDAVEYAIDEIVKHNPFGIYKKVTSSDDEK